MRLPSIPSSRTRSARSCAETANAASTPRISSLWTMALRGCSGKVLPCSLCTTTGMRASREVTIEERLGIAGMDDVHARLAQEFREAQRQYRVVARPQTHDRYRDVRPQTGGKLARALQAADRRAEFSGAQAVDHIDDTVLQASRRETQYEVTDMDGRHLGSDRVIPGRRSTPGRRPLDLGSARRPTNPDFSLMGAPQRAGDGHHIFSGRAVSGKAANNAAPFARRKSASTERAASQEVLQGVFSAKRAE